MNFHPRRPGETPQCARPARTHQGGVRERTYAPTGAEGCVNCETRGEPFFCGLPKNPTWRARRAAAVEYPKGEVLFAEGRQWRGVYVLCEGRVKLYACSGTPRALIPSIAGPGDLLGLGAAVSGRPHETSAETLGPCRLVFIKLDSFLRMLEEQPGAWARVGGELSRGYLAAHRQAVVLGLSTSAAGKLASLLLEQDAARRAPALTHEELSQMIGSSRETVTRLLNDFRRRRLVEVSGASIRVRDREALESLALAR